MSRDIKENKAAHFLLYTLYVVTAMLPTHASFSLVLSLFSGQCGFPQFILQSQKLTVCIRNV